MATQPSRTDNSNMAGHTCRFRFEFSIDILFKKSSQVIGLIQCSTGYQVIRTRAPLVPKKLNRRHFELVGLDLFSLLAVLQLISQTIRTFTLATFQIMLWPHAMVLSISPLLACSAPLFPYNFTGISDIHMISTDKPYISERVIYFHQRYLSFKYVWAIFICRGNQLQCWLRSQPPTYRHCSTASPCCRATPRGSRWRTQSWAPPRWRRRGKPPGRSRSRCTWSCQCRISLFFERHHFSPRPRL